MAQNVVRITKHFLIGFKAHSIPDTAEVAMNLTLDRHGPMGKPSNITLLKE